MNLLQKLQDMLGNYNDLCVQVDYLLNVAKEMPANLSQLNQTLVAIGSLIGKLETRRQSVRESFAETCLDLFRQVDEQSGYQEQDEGGSCVHEQNIAQDATAVKASCQPPGSGSTRFAESSGRPRSRTFASRPCRADWSAIGPERTVSPFSLRVTFTPSNHSDQWGRQGGPSL